MSAGTRDLAEAGEQADELVHSRTASFNQTEEFILSIDESNNEVVIWDALSGEKAGKWHSNHIGVPRWIEHSPTEAAFVTCGTDRSVKYWREMF
ncbi:hypothetical protein KSP40_PGU017603 [Platanthera guangdongensis]|uniref:Uncharacterized protein n=1 Tax=Platanthera guangdongensis TaxID=2320717 RepID=A0ABR2N2Q8_9ASPA